jgi:hypothetical protein
VRTAAHIDAPHHDRIGKYTRIDIARQKRRDEGNDTFFAGSCD